MIICDTGPLVAALNRKDADHTRCVDLLERHEGSLVELVKSYADFPLGAVDASVMAVAERYRCADVATLDRRHFSAVRLRHASLNLLPA